MENLVQQLWRSLTETSKYLGQLRRRKSNRVGGLLLGLTALIGSGLRYCVSAQAVDPTVVDPDLAVRNCSSRSESADKYSLSSVHPHTDNRYPGTGEEYRQSAACAERGDSGYGARPGGQLCFGTGAAGD